MESVVVGSIVVGSIVVGSIVAVVGGVGDVAGGDWTGKGGGDWKCWVSACV